MCPWSFFFYHHQQQWTQDASKCILRLPSSLPPLTSTRGSRHVKTRLEIPSLLPYLLQAQGLRCVSGLVLFLLFFSSPSRALFSLFSFLFSFFFFLSFYSTDYYLQVFFFQILKLQHLDDVSGTQKGSRHILSPVCLFFFLQSNFILLKIIYIEITYGHKHERLHHPHYKDEGLNNTSRCVVWAKSRFFFNSLGFLHTN